MLGDSTTETSNSMCSAVEWIGTDDRSAGCIPNPKSFATVSLRSTSAFDTPVVDTNIFGEEGEADQMIHCLTKEREVMAAMPADFNMTEVDRFSDTITHAEVCRTPLVPV